MGIGAAIGGIASGAGALFGAGAAGRASQQQSQMGMLGLIAQMQAQQQMRDDLAPYNRIGQSAFGQLGSLYGIGGGGSSGSANGHGGAVQGAPGQAGDFAPFYNSPDYRFAFDQGLQAVDRSAAAQGNLLSGGQMKAVQEFGQGLASQQFGNYFNRLLSMSQLGQAAGAGVAANTLASSNAIANTLGNIGTAQASGTIGSANALMGGLNNLGMYAMMAGNSSYGGGGGGLGGIGSAIGNTFLPAGTLTPSASWGI